MQENKRLCPITQSECMGNGCEWWVSALGCCAVGVIAGMSIADVCKPRAKSTQERIEELLNQLREE